MIMWLSQLSRTSRQFRVRSGRGRRENVQHVTS
jgi:hypothetical protein